MKRGDIILVDFNSVKGSEANKVRPAVVVSNDAANATAERLKCGVITVIPITSNIKNIYPFQVVLPLNDTGLLINSKAQAEQIRSVDVSRCNSIVGQLPLNLLRDIDEAIRIHLDL